MSQFYHSSNKLDSWESSGRLFITDDISVKKLHSRMSVQVRPLDDRTVVGVACPEITAQHAW